MQKYGNTSVWWRPLGAQIHTPTYNIWPLLLLEYIQESCRLRQTYAVMFYIKSDEMSSIQMDSTQDIGLLMATVSSRDG